MSSNKKTTGTKEEAKPTLVPKLRFPEFRGAEAWKVSCFDEVLSPVVRERPKPAKAYLGLGLRSHGKGTFLKPLADPAKNSMDQLYEVKTNDLIVNITFAWEGAVAIAQECDEGALVSHRFPTYTFEKGRTTPEFFRYIILDKQFIYNLGVISPGGAGRNRVLSKNDFLKLRVALPSPAEQQKIAECLSSVDELMAAQARKVDALKTHKKGLMQQLFPREGETQPRLRFPEFQNAGEWEEKPFEDFVTKSFYGTSSSTSPTGKYPVLRMGNMVDGSLDFTNLVYLDLDADSFESFRLEDGDILLNRTNSPALVGKISLFRLKSECMTASYIVTYRLNKKRIDPSFCNSMLNTPLYQARIRSFAKPSVSQANINPTTFKKDLMVAVPPLPEQQRIATCLSSLDALISVETRKLEALKCHKRGLMQQLFPSLEAVEA
jgi:type I restriction enzyme, S subunit